MKPHYAKHLGKRQQNCSGKISLCLFISWTQYLLFLILFLFLWRNVLILTPIIRKHDFCCAPCQNWQQRLSIPKFVGNVGLVYYLKNNSIEYIMYFSLYVFVIMKSYFILKPWTEKYPFWTPQLTSMISEIYINIKIGACHYKFEYAKKSISLK